MPRVIVKCRFYSTEKTVRDISGLLKYFATRPGVEKLGDGWLTEPVSKAQEDLILRFTEAHKECRRLEEYGDYNTKRTKGAASEFISAIIENYPELLSDKTYLDYIATRPRAERIEGTHGLFSDHNVALDLYEESDRLRDFNGNVFTVIVSLKREDAERLGYNTAERWRELARSKIDLVAKEHGIPLGSLIFSEKPFLKCCSSKFLALLHLRSSPSSRSSWVKINLSASRSSFIIAFSAAPSQIQAIYFVSSIIHPPCENESSSFSEPCTHRTWEQFPQGSHSDMLRSS